MRCAADITPPPPSADADAAAEPSRRGEFIYEADAPMLSAERAALFMPTLSREPFTFTTQSLAAAASAASSDAALPPARG